MNNMSTVNPSQDSVSALEGMLSHRSTSLAAKVQAACIVFLVVVPLAIVSLLLHYANGDYPGSDGSSSKCQIVGYPTNIDSCLSSR